MAETPSIESLRRLQNSLSKAIDRCAEIESRTKGQPSAELSNSFQDVREFAIQLQLEASNPFLENFQRGLWPTVNLAVRIAVDLNLFELIEDPIGLDELARKTSADRVLLLRIMRLLTCVNYFVEKPREHYRATALSRCLRIPNLRDWMKTLFDTFHPVYLQIPAFFAANGYKDMQDLSHNCFLSMHGDNLFDFLEKNPALQSDFDSAMGLQDLRPPMANPMYPFAEAVPTLSKEADAVTLVDVGGGRGQYLSRIMQENPDLQGIFILQDLPATTATVDARKEKFKVMPHDFFTPQPVHGAKFYHLRGILHDWPDAECVKILENLRPAFKRGYSKLLVQTMVLTDSPGLQNEIMLDVNMWTCCGIERDEKQWDELLGKAGFHINRIVWADAGIFAVIEADLN